MAKTHQLAHDEAAYGANAGKWIVVTDDGEQELSGPMSETDAARFAAMSNALDAVSAAVKKAAETPSRNADAKS